MMNGHADHARRLARVRRLVATGQAQAIRESAGLSQGEVARLIGVHPSAVSRWEAKQRAPHGDAALRYLDVLMGVLT